jgi:hypothetical protein
MSAIYAGKDKLSCCRFREDTIKSIREETINSVKEETINSSTVIEIRGPVKEPIKEKDNT